MAVFICIYAAVPLISITLRRTQELHPSAFPPHALKLRLRPAVFTHEALGDVRGKPLQFGGKEFGRRGVKGIVYKIAPPVKKRGKNREKKNLFLYICVRFPVQRTVRSLLLLLMKALIAI